MREPQESYKVIKINDGQKTYFQVRKVGVIYPPLPARSVTTCMAYGIESAKDAANLRDKLTDLFASEKRRKDEQGY